MLLGDRGTAGGAVGVLLGWGKRCWGAAGRRRSFTGRWHQWQGLLGCCWVLLGSHQLLRKLCRLCSAALIRSCALLGPQRDFLFIPCCCDWSDDGMGKPDLHCAASTAHVRDVRPPLLGPRVEDQFPVAPINRVSTLAAPPWICKFEFLKLADGAFATGFVDVSLNRARVALAPAFLCVKCAVHAAPPAVILVLQNVVGPLPRHQGGFRVDE